MRLHRLTDGFLMFNPSKYKHPKDADPEYDKSLDDKRAFKYCIHLIAKQDYSKYKLTKKLKSKGYSQQVVGICVQKLLDLDYLREDDYTRMRILGIIKKGYGKRYVIQKCSQEKLIVDEVLIDEILEQEEICMDGILGYQVEKRTRNHNFDEMPQDVKYKTIDKIRRQLFSRGFDLEAIKRHI